MCTNETYFQCQARMGHWHGTASLKYFIVKPPWVLSSLRQSVVLVFPFCLRVQCLSVFLLHYLKRSALHFTCVVFQDEASGAYWIKEERVQILHMTKTSDRTALGCSMRLYSENSLGMNCTFLMEIDTESQQMFVPDGCGGEITRT